MTGAGRRSRRGRSVARRRALIEAARRSIRVHGSSVSLELIAAEAGISRPILYRHFGDRQGLAEAVAHDAIARALGGAPGEVPGAPIADDWIVASDLRTTLAELVRRTLDFIEDDPALYRFVLEERAFRGIRAAGDPGTGPLGVLVAPLVAALEREGHERPAATLRATAIAGMLVACVGSNLQTRLLDRAELERAIFDFGLRLGEVSRARGGT